MRRPDLSALKRTRRSTIVLVLLFAGVFVLYIWVRPAPIPSTSGNIVDQYTQQTKAPVRPHTHSPAPTHSRTATKQPTSSASTGTSTATSTTSTGATRTGSPTSTGSPSPGTSATSTPTATTTPTAAPTTGAVSPAP